MIELLQRYKLTLQTVFLAMAAIVCLVALASYLYLFKKPLAEYAQLKQARVMLEAKNENETRSIEGLEELEKEIKTLADRLYGNSPELSANALAADVIGRLDQISERQGVHLTGVKPGTAQPVYVFEELPFNVTVYGSYYGLYSWLYEVERELGPMVVKRFVMRSKTGSKELDMELEIASYRPLEREL